MNSGPTVAYEAQPLLDGRILINYLLLLSRNLFREASLAGKLIARGGLSCYIERVVRRESLELLIVLVVVLTVGGCHKRTPAAISSPTAAAPPPPPAPSCTLTVEPASVSSGQSVTVSWESHDATDVDLEPGGGKQQAQGSTSVTPHESTTYTLAATGPGGKGSCSARVTVAPPPPSVRPSVTEENIAATAESSLKDAYFDLDKADLRPDAQQALTTDAEFLKAHPEIKITIEGYCDQRGSEEYNLGLGDRRASNAKNFLVNSGIPSERMTTVSFGKDRLFCSEATEDCWQQNRRVHLALQRPQKTPE
jgi:peptidoglycan-associated lipoprotein